MGELTQKDAYRMVLTEYPDVLSFEQMCEALRVSPKTGYKILRSGQIICLKVGRAYRIPKAHMLTYLMIGTHPAEAHTRETE
jgi:excisionase family DNA binding protein